MADNNWRILTRPLVDDNPLTLQILGICSALAVTTSLDTALLMSLVVVCVLAITTLGTTNSGVFNTISTELN